MFKTLKTPYFGLIAGLTALYSLNAGAGAPQIVAHEIPLSAPTMTLPSGSGVVVTYLGSKTQSSVAYRLVLQRTTAQLGDDSNTLKHNIMDSSVIQNTDDFSDRRSASLEVARSSSHLMSLFSPSHSLSTPTLASEANKDIMNSEIFSKFQQEQAAVVMATSMRVGFYETDKDTVAPARPVQLESVENIARQQEMARELRKYVLIQGLPKFMLSREETKPLGDAIDKTLSAVQNTTAIAVKSEENKWSFNTGINPLTGHTYAQFQDQTWVIAASTNFKNNQPVIEAKNNFGEQKQFIFSANYVLNSSTLNPSLGWAMTSTTSTTVSTTLPFKSSQFGTDVFSTVSLSHSF
jgi:hypothetical protein